MLVASLHLLLKTHVFTYHLVLVPHSHLALCECDCLPKAMALFFYRALTACHLRTEGLVRLMQRVNTDSRQPPLSHGGEGIMVQLQVIMGKWWA